jgi:peroxiredoxin|tara:strand:+ start:9362 stop:10096 length:735 start_codon:yes stop_codon:yes gene_type:complete
MTLKNFEGNKIPLIDFKIRDNDEWKTLTTQDVFHNKTVVAFSLPGAFTPTCSSSHLPRYNELAPVFFENGVDEIVCLSVNDTFVMNEWAKDQESQNVRLLPDGNGEFTEQLGMLVDKSALGFGKRSWRYSMLVKNGVVEKAFIEPDVPGDPFEVSDADTMLKYINPKAAKPDQVAIFTKEGCSFCAEAKEALTKAGFDYAEIPLSHQTRNRIIGAVTGEQAVPQIFINGKYIGDSQALNNYLNR